MAYVPAESSAAGTEIRDRDSRERRRRPRSCPRRFTNGRSSPGSAKRIPAIQERKCIPANIATRRNTNGSALQGDTATVGITDYAQHELGDVVYVELPKVGAKVDGRKIVRHGGIGESGERNLCAGFRRGQPKSMRRSADAPELINTDPHGQGWLIKVKAGESGRNRRN